MRSPSVIQSMLKVRTNRLEESDDQLINMESLKTKNKTLY